MQNIASHTKVNCVTYTRDAIPALQLIFSLSGRAHFFQNYHRTALMQHVCYNKFSHCAGYGDNLKIKDAHSSR